MPILLQRREVWDAWALDALERSVLERIDGRASVHALAEAAGRTDWEIGRTIAGLEQQGIVAFSGSRSTALHLVKH